MQGMLPTVIWSARSSRGAVRARCRLWDLPGPLSGAAPFLDDVPGLGVQAVRLVKEATQQLHMGAAFFCVEVVMQNGDSWRVMRRFSDFDKLCIELGPPSLSFPTVPFPRKHMFFVAGQRLEARRLALERWLQRALGWPAGGAWCRPLRQFLAGRQTDLEGSTGHAMQSSSTSADVDQSMVLEIQVPEGVASGQLLGVRLPNGTQVNIIVPPGVMAGQLIDVFYDPDNSSLIALV